MHKTLQRQIERYVGNLEGATDAQLKLFDAISKTYTDYEKEYSLIERSLDISSKELSEVNNRIRAESDMIKERATELEKLNNLMINRELKMVELKERNRELQRELELLRGKEVGSTVATVNVAEVNAVE